MKLLQRKEHRYATPAVTKKNSSRNAPDQQQ
jgi:hypothetical protein